MSITINSDESEGYFDEFINDRLNDIVDHVINEGDLVRTEGDGSDLIVEINDIVPPTFSYGNEGGGQGQGGVGQPGTDEGRLRFDMPFRQFMELIKEKLQLPDLRKEGKGSIKQISYKYNTFGPTGVILDKKRTFKRAFKSSIGMRIYDPAEGKNEIEIRRKDRRYKLPQRIEIPRYQAVVFYLGDISYSTYGERLDLQKRLLGFAHHWLDYNYGKGNVEHRFFVHDVKAYEVTADQFYQVGNIGGTRASIIFDLIGRVARNEYDITTTNFYAFYVGDGELFQSDANEVADLLSDELRPVFNRVCVIEVMPSHASVLAKTMANRFERDPIIRQMAIEQKREILNTIKKMFGASHA